MPHMPRCITDLPNFDWLVAALNTLHHTNPSQKLNPSTILMEISTKPLASPRKSLSLSRRITVQGRRSHGDVGHRRAALPHLACLLENAGAAATARAIERRRSRWGQRSIELCDTHRQIAVDGQLWLFWAGLRMKYKHMSRTNTCLRGQWFTPAKPQKRKQVDYACHATKR